MTIVMGLDQHRAQITADWVDTDTGEVKRGRVAPADRAGVRKFLGRFGGQELDVALEATTGWRFVVEELRSVGAEVHLAEPAEASARRGTKKRAKNDRADARHLRELLMAGRVPESWIPPEHILDLRARVRLRHTLVDQRGEWQQRMQAVLYHHGCPQRRALMTGEGREWLESQPLPASAREQVTVAVAMVNALKGQIAPLSEELRSYARRQAGCKGLMAHYGIGALTAVTILAELGDCRRFSSSRHAVRYAGMDIERGMATTPTYDRSGGGEQTGAGWVMFAGIMLLIVGVLNVIYGIAAVGNSKFFVHETQYILSGLNTWGWVTIILGALEIIAAFSIWAGGGFGRWFGILVAGLSAIGALLSMPAYPFWSLAVFAIDILIIYGLAAYGGQPIDA